MTKRLLIIIDPQNDFISGSLKVPDAEEKMLKLAADIPALVSGGEGVDEVAVTIDYHPINHCSFSEYGGTWPAHCIQLTEGVNIFEPLETTILEQTKKGIKFSRVFKGMLEDQEEYGAFYNPDHFIWDIADIEEIYIAGIMSEFCVVESVKGLVETIGIDPSKIFVLLPYVSTLDNHNTLEKYLKEAGVGTITTTDDHND